MSNLVRVLVLMSACLTFNAGAETFDKDKPIWEGGRLAHLARYIGTYNHEAVLNDPYVKAELQRLTGPYFERFMRVDRISPIEYHANGVLVLRGGHVHKADIEHKIVAIDLHSGKSYVYFGTDEWSKIFSEDIRYDYLPQVILHSPHGGRLWDIAKSPPNGPDFEWIKASKPTSLDPQRR